MNTYVALRDRRLQGRVLRAFAQAGLEMLLALSFTIPFLLLLPLAAERFADTLRLVELQGRISLHFWEREANRVEWTTDTLDDIVPHGSSFRVYELDEHPSRDYNQTIIVEIEYRNITGFIRFNALHFHLSEAIVGQRGGSRSEIISIRGPGTRFFGLALHLALIPWLVLRFWWLPKHCPPTKPFFPKSNGQARVFALCVAGGMGLGLLIPVAFSMGEAMDLLNFSDRMPNLETFGIKPELLWIAALSFALAGAVEEAFFRGLLLRRFAANALPLLGVVVCAFWFTLIHFSYFSWNSGNLVYALWIALVGLSLGVMTIRLNSWVPAAVLHASYNFTVTAMLGLPAVIA